MRPTFPRYDGRPLPAALNPLNVRHYVSLADWIFFKPSRLKQYLWQADAELYQQAGRGALRRAMRLPACRNLWVMGVVLAAVLAGLIAWGVSVFQGTDVRWVGVAVGVAGGVAVGVAYGVAYGVAVGVAFGVAST